ncbi:MAG TPA: sigma factor-like helix-turn-helix DNA-binding protein [Candidatus Aquilonibacter sp.]|nr:sigma factor-like helix-turn-helix DNA-binding protein [Candidatus Aquilonibacter sp.]
MVSKPAMTFEQIGRELGVTRERARQLFESGMQKLRTRNHGAALDMYAVFHSRRRYAIPKGTSRAGRYE